MTARDRETPSENIASHMRLPRPHLGGRFNSRMTSRLSQSTHSNSSPSLEYGNRECLCTDPTQHGWICEHAA